MPAYVSRITPSELYEELLGQEELALLDVREELTFSESHILYASCMPLSRLELFAPRLLARQGVPIVVCDGGEGLAERAAGRLHELGYRNVRVLTGGTPAWAAAGYELFSGVNVPSKAFGEFVEHRFGTPSISAQELHAMMERGDDMVVLDSRPFDEYVRESIPSGICVPGAELVYRVHDLAPSPKTTVVVNCAGRTRSIIGAQSLRNAGISNKVVALRNGTMGWHLAGLEVERGASRSYDHPSPQCASKARTCASTVAQRFGVRIIDQETLESWQTEAEERSLYIFDVRSPEEYRSSHWPAARSAPGGQLVQETDMFVGTLRSRIVLIDDTGVRARMTASWLAQMGWTNVAVLERVSLGETVISGAEPQVWLGLGQAQCETVSPTALNEAYAGGDVTVIDLSLSRHYRSGHIPGARYAVRARLGDVLARLSGNDPIYLACEDGNQSRLAAAEYTGAVSRPLIAVEGGMRAWCAAGYPLEKDAETWSDSPDDVWLKPFERGIGLEQAMDEYLLWEVALVEQLERDRTAPFVRSQTP